MMLAWVDLWVGHLNWDEKAAIWAVISLDKFHVKVYYFEI